MCVRTFHSNPSNAQVNTASRMESTGEAMRVHLSESSAHALLATGKWMCEQRGHVSVKGKGEMNTFWLIGPYEPNDV